MTTIHKCECPLETRPSALADRLGFEPEEEKARDHRPNECPGDVRVRLYERNGHQRWLCSCCWTFGDEPVDLGAAEIMER